MIKRIIKRIIGQLLCFIYGIDSGKNCYVAYNIKITKRKSIKLQNNVQISKDTLMLLVSPNAKIEIGNNCRFAHHLQISCAKKVIIKNDVNIAPFVFISDHNHEYRDINVPIMNQGIMIDKEDAIIIDEGTWIGTKTTIVGNVHIGKHCVIGANSVVTKNIPNYSIAVGSPAKVIKKFNFKTNQWEKV